MFFKTALLASLLLSASGLAVRAETVEPKIYYFGASGCDFCGQGLAFLERLQTADTRVRTKTFDIVGNSDDATIYVRVVNAIGLQDPRVPMTVVGRHVFIGFETDETTGLEIKLAVEQCRLASCPDLIQGLMTFGPEVASETPRPWVIDQRFAKTTVPGR